MADLEQDQNKGIIGKVVELFLESKLSIFLIIIGLSLGTAAILITPREEEPQIVVPMADVHVSAPGASAKEVEKLVATPLEKLLWQIDGVEYVYSTSQKEKALVTVRFYVGQDRVQSLVKLYNQIRMHIDQVPPLVKNWVVKPVEVDDVPILSLTFFSDKYTDYQLRRVGQEVMSRLTEVKNISRSILVGGRERVVRVELFPDKLSAMGVSALEVVQALKGADASVQAGKFNLKNKSITVKSNAFLHSAQEVKNLIVGLHKDSPVYLKDVAKVIDGPEEADSYTRMGFSNYFRQQNQPRTNFADKDLKVASTASGSEGTEPAVTLALSKKQGANAVWVARNILDKLKELKKTVIPEGIKVEVTRNYGQTAQDKVNSLLSNLFFAVLTVIILLAITLGRREAAIVALAVPLSFSLTLFVSYLLGYSINRVTLFALILSLGLVVDDPITNVDNIQRHINKGLMPPKQATLYAVNEVLPPVLMSTLAIIICFSPMFFITGMMGPYMSPMAANVPLTVTFSTICALTVVPWMTHKLLSKKGKKEKSDEEVQSKESQSPLVLIEKIYRKVLTPFLEFRWARYLLLLFILIGLILAISLVLFRKVPLKLLPFDNKDELQLVIDMPEGMTLEHTSRVVGEFEDYLRKVPEVVNFVSYIGTSSPMDFNGMVRHYYWRKTDNLADIRIDLLDKQKRQMQSHGIVLRLRRDLQQIADKHGADLKIVEQPPGPPVLSTLVAEIYAKPGIDYKDLIQAAKKLKGLMQKEDFVVEIDGKTIFPYQKLSFIIDKEKAALHGISAEQINKSLSLALQGNTPATVHLPDERQPVMVKLIFPRGQRSGQSELARLPVKSKSGKMIPLAELGRFETDTAEQPIYHKNLQRVVYVTADMAGRPPGEAILDLKERIAQAEFGRGIEIKWDGEGEWQITLRVFRDLSLAFAAALLGIYVLLSIQTSSFSLPLIILLAIPLTLLGIMPGFWALNLLSEPIKGFPNPVFFTATAMIGMIALGGIVIRNSVVLIDFILNALKSGETLKEAILQSGATRFRPIVLTALTTAMGVWPITLDPVFSGLAWSLIFGLFASTFFTLLVVPITFYAINRKELS